MTWAETIQIVKRRMQQAGTNPISDDIYKIYGTNRQIAMSEKAPYLFEVRRSFSTVAAQAEYGVTTTIGPDMLQIYRMIYDSNTELYPLKQSAITYPLQSGQPERFYVRDGMPSGKKIGLVPTPSTSGKVVNVFGYRRPPRWVMSIKHNGASNATGATVNIDGTTMTLTITGGSNAGTTSINMALSTLNTLYEVDNYISTIALGFTATTNSDIYSVTEASSLLESTESSPGTSDSPSCLNKTIYLYEKPEVPYHAERCLIEGMMADACLDQGMDNRYQMHEMLFQQMLIERDAYTRRQARGGKNAMIGDAYACDIAPELRLPGGWLVR